MISLTHILCNVWYRVKKLTKKETSFKSLLILTDM
jgi:hypothetical protein